MQNIVMLALVSFAYAIVITGVVALLRALGVSNRRAVAWGFLIYGVATGALAAWAWPIDSATYPNVYAVLAGDWLYVRAIEWIGDPRSSNAHETIPWLLRVPQVYAGVSTVLGGGAGIAIQWLVNRWLDARESGMRAHAPHSGAAA